MATDQEVREQRGLVIAATCKLKRQGLAWLVPSQSGCGRYSVLLHKHRPSCTCPDFQDRGQPCKHIFAARYTLKRERSADGTETVTESLEISHTVERKPTYRQDWTAYNRAQTCEKELFQVLLNDLCRGVKEPVQAPRRGRPRLPLADVIFSAAFKVYSTVSGRRFMSDLRDAHDRGHISRLPHYNSIFAYLEDEQVTPHLKSMIHTSSLPLASVESHFAADSSGFSTSRFQRWYDHKYGERKSKIWVKAHVMVGVKTNVVTAVEIAGPTQNDSPMLPPLLRTTARNFNVSEVSADMGYLSRENLNVIESHGALPLIPFKTNSICRHDETPIWERMFHYFQFRREEFMGRYHLRSNVESTFSMVKAKFRDHIRSRTDTAMKNEALCKFLCHNVCCVIQEVHELGIAPNFWAESTPAQKLGIVG